MGRHGGEMGVCLCVRDRAWLELARAALPSIPEGERAQRCDVHSLKCSESTPGYKTIQTQRPPNGRTHRGSRTQGNMANTCARQPPAGSRTRCTWQLSSWHVGRLARAPAPVSKLYPTSDTLPVYESFLVPLAGTIRVNLTAGCS